MGFPVPTTDFVGLAVTMTWTQRKGAVNTLTCQANTHARTLEDGLNMQPQRFVMLGINTNSYNAVVWVKSQFSEPINIWWLNRKQHTSIRDTFESLVT
jgi:hypothetical protein